jgi:4-hydroxy-tetrahydrodipicolinate synthase
MYRPKGIITALVTAFDGGGKLSEERLRKSVEFQIANGVHGLCPTGGTGEPLSLSEEEYKKDLDIVIDQVKGRVPVIAGVLLVDQAMTIRIAKHAARAGAAAVMLIPPYFVRTSQRQVFRHFSDIAAATDIPLIVFNTPSRSGVNVEPEFVVRLAKEVDAFVGIKEGSGNLAQVQSIIRDAPAEFSVLQASDALQVATWAMGGDGGIVAIANLTPDVFVEMWNAFQRGELSRARELQLKILPLNAVTYAEGHPGPLKRALELVGRPAGEPRPPIYPVTEETDRKLQAVLKDLKLL